STMDYYSMGSEKPSERSRWTPLTRMLLSGEMTQEKQKQLTSREKFDRWMINEGYRRFFVFVFMILHGLVFALACVNFALKDNLQVARDIFGTTFVIARAAALVLHVDVALVLFPVCRTFISLARQTPLNGIIQFDKNITFHKTIAWSIVFFSWVHTIAHWVNFGMIAAKNNLGVYGWLLANFVSGPGWTGYVMLIALMGMVITSMEKPRRANYERFWSPTNFGRPNWDMIFRGIRKLHSPAEAGVFFCGPKGLGSTLHIFCNKYSEPGFSFKWGKENF
ncbi:hypothetical protein BN1723_008259, partial [Verticillium longisporum]